MSFIYIFQIVTSLCALLACALCVENACAIELVHTHYYVNENMVIRDEKSDTKSVQVLHSLCEELCR